MSEVAEKCGKLVGKGTIMYPCIVDGKDHDGPCAAREHASSMVARRSWVAQQQSDEAPIQPDIVQSSQSNGFGSHADRLLQAGESLKGEFQSLPPAIQSWMMGASAQLALVQLWESWKRASEAGELFLVLTGDEINLLVPEKLRI